MEVKKLICEKDIENSNDMEVTANKNDKSNVLYFCSKIMEENKKLIQSNIEINSKINKLETLLNNQQKKLQKKMKNS